MVKKDTTWASSQTKKRISRGRPLRIGYVPLTDCAPLLVAREKNFFERHDLLVELSPEPGWATVREKMVHGELDAAHAPASMVFEMSLGWGCLPTAAQTALVTAHHGNAIALSQGLWEEGVRDVHSLRELVHAEKGKRRFTFAGVLRFSSQNYLLRKWLRSGGLVPDRDVDMAIVPPPLVFRCLQKGHLDGYCVAEPFTSIGIFKKVAWAVELSSRLDPFHPEKVFLVRESFAREREEEHLALVAALIEACRWCDDPMNRAELIPLLADQGHLALDQSVVANALGEDFDMGQGRRLPEPQTIFYGGPDQGRPRLNKARWVLDQILINRFVPESFNASDSELAKYFREDFFERALALVSGSGGLKETERENSSTMPAKASQ
ncbi:MAG: ABC transporter substrate-binding protein [Opitutales bacterium]|nr:ABC transporter substrate-binding protein [Opitutales bacterium]MCH8540071.1 ABC transporter substrate-binding protein [Opitutales bacterium]